MAQLTCRFFSETLNLATVMSVILPERLEPGEKCPVLWLLHGYTEDHTAWCRRTSLERYVSGTGMAVIMPDGANSYYTNMKQGRPYWDFLSHELPLIARSWFPLSQKREDNYVAGLSMGGYGAFKLALRQPDLFAAAGSFAGALDIQSPVMKRRNSDFPLIFGEEVEPEENLFVLASRARDRGQEIPRLFQFCGTEDFLYKDNLRFRDYLAGLDIPVTWREERGIHDWDVWDRNFPLFLEWLTGRGEA
ncbi:MAG: esterase family protein [Spirochaetales bacterium]|nr:esterase family protein [Spirochaetales bacterium]